MQIYADVLEREIFLSGTTQACAYGSAILGAVNQNGYPSLVAASNKLGKVGAKTYKPNPENSSAYVTLYREYETLCEFFANSDNKTMEILRKGEQS